MPRRSDKAGDLFCQVSLAEREVVDEMKRMCGIASDANLIRTALWNFSEHLDMKIDLRAGVFDERHYHKPKKAKP